MRLQVRGTIRLESGAILDICMPVTVPRENATMTAGAAALLELFEDRKYRAVFISVPVVEEIRDNANEQHE